MLRFAANMENFIEQEMRKTVDQAIWKQKIDLEKFKSTTLYSAHDIKQI